MPYLRLKKVNDAKLPNFYCKEKHMNTHHHPSIYPSIHPSIYEEKRTSGKEREEKDLI
jgi:hypothetical protein